MVRDEIKKKINKSIKRGIKRMQTRLDTKTKWNKMSRYKNKNKKLNFKKH